jgi:hypothetical protein
MKTPSSSARKSLIVQTRLQGNEMKYFWVLSLLVCSTPLTAAGDDCCITGIMAPTNQIDLLPGQSVIFKPAKGKMQEIRIIEGNIKPGAGELRADFSSGPNEAKLIVTNGSGEAYNYSAWILDKKGAQKGVSTSICTVRPGLFSLEHWPYPIKAIRIGTFKSSKNSKIICR